MLIHSRVVFIWHVSRNNLPLAFLSQRNRLATLPIDDMQRAYVPGIGTLGYRKSQGSGRALVFVHGTNLASGPHELRPLRAAFAANPGSQLVVFVLGPPETGPAPPLPREIPIRLAPAP